MIEIVWIPKNPIDDGDALLSFCRWVTDRLDFMSVVQSSQFSNSSHLPQELVENKYTHHRPGLWEGFE